MSITKIVLVFVLMVLTLPIFTIVFLSFKNTENEIFHWYYVILDNKTFLNSLSTTLITSVLISFLTTVLGTIISLSYFVDNLKKISFIFILILGLIPSDIIAINLSKFSQDLGIQGSNLFTLTICLIMYGIPYIVLFMWVRFYFMDDTLLKVGRDLGMSSKSLLFNIILPTSKITISTSGVFIFLLVFNEYSRVSYLSGAEIFLSEFIYGKLYSGTNYSVYAGSSLVIIFTAIPIIILLILSNLKRFRKIKWLFNSI